MKWFARGKVGLSVTGGIVLITLAFFSLTFGSGELAVEDDPLVRMPGTQPGQVSLEGPGRCLNCHGGYNQAVEPGFNWQGSMMAQAARDFLYWSCLTVAAQDAYWATGSFNATDICLRCHMPKGWLEGRSDPTNGSLMSGDDFDGVQCDFCHRMSDPFFEATYRGTREGDDWLNYWDETNQSDTPSQAAADETHAVDANDAKNIFLFNGQPFYNAGNLPPAGYTESGSGQYFVSPGNDKRASFADAAARHRMLYSRYHKSKYFCATCHDVSNPVLANLQDDPTAPLTTETRPASAYFHVERTFSEFMLSAYGQQGGAAGVGPFAPEIFTTSDAGNRIARCQDCHMRDLSGVACNKKGVPVRPQESVEHPQSGQPLHDLTGGNVWVATVLASAIPDSPNYNAVNAALLNQGAEVLTLDLSQGQGIDPQALLAGADRARQQLQLAAAIAGLAYDPGSGSLSFRIQNQTGHKLLSGFPEGRRMFVNIRAYDEADRLIFQVNPYDGAAATLKGLGYSYNATMLTAPAPLGADEVHLDELVYEMHPSADLRPVQEFVEEKTFHFVLATGRYKDNRIPPKGFRIDEAAERLSVPVWEGADAPGYFSAAEYAGGYDEVQLDIVPGAARVEVNLYYQTTSREYVEFLRNEINGTGGTLPDAAYIAGSDPFFDRLRAWGDTLWQLWAGNRTLPGAAPLLMASAATGGGGCGAPAPTLVEAASGQKAVNLAWSDEHSDNPEVLGYRLYYDQGGKSQLVADLSVGEVSLDAQGNVAYTDSGLTNGVEYCYKVSSYQSDCESAFSNVLCATPKEGGGSALAGVDTLEVGRYQTTGKGKDRITEFVAATAPAVFQAGEEVVFRLHAVDGQGAPVAGAEVDLRLAGPETHLLAADATDAEGFAEAIWQTSEGKGKNKTGTSPGEYTAEVFDLTAPGFTWDGVATATGFTIE